MKLLLTIAILCICPQIILGDDWPQWMGPNRDNSWREEGIVEKLPAGGPKVIWRSGVAGGYAGPSVANGWVFVTDFVSDSNVKIDNFGRKSFQGTERVLCLDAETGSQKWKYEYPVKYTISYPAGPRCTPIIHQGKLYTLGAEGNLFCFDAESGKVIWSKNLPVDYKTKAALWGYAGHPLIDGQKLLCVAGGEGSHAVAFDKDTGKELWRAETAKEQGYCPPLIIKAGGVRQLILAKPDGIASVDPETGKQFWSVPYSATSGSIIMTPIHSGEYLFIGGYSNKSLMLKLAADKPAAEEVWRDKSKHGVSPVNVQPYLDNGIMYGVDQNGMLYAVEIPSGKRLWETFDPMGKKRLDSGTAFIVKQGDRFWLFNDIGELIICKMSPKGYEELSRAKIIDTTNTAFGRDVVWCMPAFANKRLYVRNDKECICVDLAK